MSANDPLWHSVPGCESLSVIASDAGSGRQADAELRDSHESLRHILETTLDCFWRADREGKLLEANPAYIRLSGYTREELLGLGIFDLAVIPGATTIEKHLECIIGYGSDTFESIQLRKDGSIWHAEVSAAFLDIGGSGEFFVFLRDITGRKRIEPLAVSIDAKAVIGERHRDRRILVVDDQPLNLEVARMIREIVLQQNAYHAVDTYSPMPRQYTVLKTIKRFADLSKKAVENEVLVDVISNMPLRTRLGKSKFEEIVDQELADIGNEMDKAFDALGGK